MELRFCRTRNASAEKPHGRAWPLPNPNPLDAPDWFSAFYSRAPALAFAAKIQETKLKIFTFLIVSFFTTIEI
jgi:hypothetical protein